MPLFLLNFIAASMILMSFFWQGAVLDRGRLLFVLPTSIVDHILLISISYIGPNFFVGLYLGMEIFLWRVHESLIMSLKFEMMFLLIFGNHIVRLGFFFFFGYSGCCMVSWEQMMPWAWACGVSAWLPDVIVVGLLRLLGIHFTDCSLVWQI